MDYAKILRERAAEAAKHGHEHKALSHIDVRNRNNISAWRRRFAAHRSKEDAVRDQA